MPTSIWLGIALFLRFLPRLLSTSSPRRCTRMSGMLIFTGQAS